MVEITRDVALCQKCGLCAMTCMSTVFQQEEKGTVPTIGDLERCYGCGQCVAICPQGAITHSRYPEGTVHPIRSEYLPTYDHILELIRSRRSKRLYHNREVERDMIEKVLDAARFGPSGHNSQTTEFIVIQDKDMIHEISALTAKSFAKMAKRVQTPIAKVIMRLTLGQREALAYAEAAPELGGIAAMFDRGMDYILRGAPVLLLFCADNLDFFASENANLAVQNATLAAETLGLGCFYPGFVMMACSFDDDIPKLISLPENYQIYGALAMGYPKIRFKRWPERNPAKVTWMEAA